MIAAVMALLVTQLVVLAVPVRAATSTRLAGSSRITTAVAVSRAAFPSGSDVAVLADALGYADALAAAPLAGAAGAPVLLNDRDRLHPDVEGELRRLDPSTVVVMGGERAQSATVTRALEGQGRTVVRVAGPNRFATAALAAQEAVDRWLADGDGDAGREVVIALGRHPLGDQRAWPDALAAGVLAGRTHRPLLLVERDAVPQQTADALRELGATSATVIGGEGAISTATADALGVPYTRIAGANRYATGTLLADAAIAAGADVTDLTIVTGRDYPDALGAVPAVLQGGGVLLLVDGQSLAGSGAARDWLEQHPEIERVTVVGGPGAIADATVAQVEAAIEGTTELRLALQPVVAADSALAIRSDHLGRLVVAERAGRVAVLVDGSLRTLLDIRDRVSTSGERGLLDLQLHPDYATNRRFFVHYNDLGGDTVLAEYRADDAGLSTVGGGNVLYTTEQPASNHNGGGLQFLPDDTLLLALGDGGGANDQFGNGQDTSTPLGSLLRFDVSQPGTAVAPADNPYVGRSGDDLVWASGLRNPFRISFDAPSGVLYVADVGQDRWEEVNAVGWTEAGLDYGWSTVEGPECFPLGAVCDRSGLTDPAHFYSSSDAPCAVTGGHVHRGSIRALDGHYFFGDFCTGQVWTFRLVDGQATEVTEWTEDLNRDDVLRFGLQTFGIDGAGETYVANRQTVYRIVRA